VFPSAKSNSNLEVASTSFASPGDAKMELLPVLSLKIILLK